MISKNMTKKQVFIPMAVFTVKETIIIEELHHSGSHIPLYVGHVYSCKCTVDGLLVIQWSALKNDSERIPLFNGQMICILVST